ncbi:MAG: hypothetical protein EGP82_00100 [Odoribacter splanchnicus]|nr:hypothetical protein [Odoribacter splanchnicus]
MPMNRLCLIIAFLISPYIIWAQTFISAPNDTTALVEYNDGRQWVYRDIDRLVVGMTNEVFKDEYGKYYQIGIFISNGRDSTLTFNSEEVFAELVSKKRDTITMEVYTNEEFQKQIKKSQMWAMALYGLSAGINSASAGYSTTYTTSYSPYGYAYTSVNRNYDANAAYQANMAANMQIQTLGKMMENDRKLREQGYLKLNTVHPGDAIIGYMNIKYKKGNKLFVTVNIGDRVFPYLWDIEKKKKS